MTVTLRDETGERITGRSRGCWITTAMRLYKRLHPKLRVTCMPLSERLAEDYYRVQFGFGVGGGATSLYPCCTVSIER